MSKLLQNFNVAGTTLFFHILTVRCGLRGRHARSWGWQKLAVANLRVGGRVPPLYLQAPFLCMAVRCCRSAWECILTHAAPKSLPDTHITQRTQHILTHMHFA
jgi:hypothetical protein